MRLTLPSLIAVGVMSILAGCGKPTSSGSTTSPSAAPQLLLNEILFHPIESRPQFVEIKNPGQATRGDGLALVTEAGQRYALPDRLQLKPGEVLLVVFDGQSKVSGNTIHADRASFLNREAGAVKLVGASGAILDQVAWGLTQPHAVRLGRGGVVADLTPGTTIGRSPLSTRVDPLEWVTFAPEQATPGAANPQPAVEILLPVNGAVFDKPNVSLSWYPIAGAVQYRVQVATENTFSAPVVDQTVPLPPLAPPVRLPAGHYFWRVQALASNGSAASFSPVNTFTIRGASPEAEPLARKTLLVPYIQQHKDTAMLLLESPHDTGPDAWDVDHKVLHEDDPADNANCALAATAMIAAYYGAQLSQDRIGYEVFKGGEGGAPFPGPYYLVPKAPQPGARGLTTIPPPNFDPVVCEDVASGPEGDLNYGRGLSDNQLTTALSFALGAIPSDYPTAAAAWTKNVRGNADLWAIVKVEIDAGRPVYITIPGHALVAIGYVESGGDQFVTINDPWYGTYLIDITELLAIHYWLMPHKVNPVSDEPGIRRDSDGDGVVDFDETQRFHTDPNNQDTDGDKIPDKVEIHASVFDPKHGYAVGTEDHNGRDFDCDGVPMELDLDSDGGGCFDGVEDTDHDGKYSPARGETYNFDKQDDRCIVGTEEISYDITANDGVEDVREVYHLLVTFNLHETSKDKLEGQAHATWTSSQEGSGYGSCPPRKTRQDPETVAWDAQLTGTIRRLPGDPARITHFEFDAAPERGPPYKWITPDGGEWCRGSTDPRNDNEWRNPHGFDLKPGEDHCDRVDTPPLPANSTGQHYFKVHVESRGK